MKGVSTTKAFPVKQNIGTQSQSAKLYVICKNHFGRFFQIRLSFVGVSFVFEDDGKIRVLCKDLRLTFARLISKPCLVKLT